MTQFPLKVVLNVDKESVDTYFELLDEARLLLRYLIQYVKFSIKPTEEGYVTSLTLENPGMIKSILSEIEELLSRLHKRK